MSELAFRLLQLQESVTTLKEERTSLEQQINERLAAKQQVVARTRSQQRLLRRKMALQQQIQLIQGCRDSAATECDVLHAANQERRAKLGQARAKLARAHTEQIEHGLQPVTRALLWQYATQSKRVATLRRALLGQLSTLFQLRENDEGRMEIVGIRLEPSRLHAPKIKAASGNEATVEQLSTGLGYVVHFLKCVCMYLCVVPPYAMEFHGSASWLVGLDGARYELVAERGNVKESFRTALRLLNSNVCWLCALAGVPRVGGVGGGGGGASGGGGAGGGGAGLPAPQQGGSGRARRELQLLENLRRLATAAPKLGMEGPLRILPAKVTEGMYRDVVHQPPLATPNHSPGGTQQPPHIGGDGASAEPEPELDSVLDHQPQAAWQPQSHPVSSTFDEGIPGIPPPIRLSPAQ
jgi:hypothetical protein|eukprot:COSAG01_NODE_5259_length_4377_cov_1089.320477_2_plen_410_part_00